MSKALPILAINQSSNRLLEFLRSNAATHIFGNPYLAPSVSVSVLDALAPVADRLANEVGDMVDFLQKLVEGGLDEGPKLQAAVAAYKEKNPERIRQALVAMPPEQREALLQSLLPKPKKQKHLAAK